MQTIDFSIMNYDDHCHKGALVEVVLLRHGKPEIDTLGKVSASDFGRWIAKYDQAGIDMRHKPTKEAIERAEKCSFTVCSTLLRSVESAKALNIDSPNLVSHLFRECEMPYSNWAYPKLSILSWSVLFRILQLAGYSSNAESYKSIKVRSENCANQLTELSRKHESVLFVGHGTIIWFIHKRLLRMGWTGPQKAARKHWAFSVYTFRKTEHNRPLS